MKLLLGILLLFISLNSYAQDWKTYSDSIYRNIKQNNFEKAGEFLELAEQDLLKSNFLRDTIYADFLYRKGLVHYFTNNNKLVDFKESLIIWGDSKKKNPVKTLKINYFIGEIYYQREDYKLAYKYHEKSYQINKINNIKIQPNFNNSIYTLLKIDYYENKDEENVKKYATEYIELLKETAADNFNFNYINAYKFVNDFDGQEKYLLKYLENYQSSKIINPDLLFKINFNLMMLYSVNNPLNSIKYGEISLNILINNNYDIDQYTEVVYVNLIANYGSIKDNINRRKYKKLKNKYFPDDEINHIDFLDNLLEIGDFVNFETKFREFESSIIAEEKYEDLVELYATSFTLYSQGQIFKKKEIENQFSFLGKKRKYLGNRYKLFLDQFLAEYYTANGNYSKALSISNNNINNDDLESNLSFYGYKIIAEQFLGTGNSKKSIIKANELAVNLYGKESPEILSSLLLFVIDSSLDNDISVKIKSAVKGLEIIYSNNMEETEIAAKFWVSLASLNLVTGNFIDSKLYFNNALEIYYKQQFIQDPSFYSSCLVGAARNYCSLNDFDNSKKYLLKAKTYLDSSELPNASNVLYGDYFYFQGDYLFFQDKFKEAKNSYEKAFNYYGNVVSKGRNLNYLLCDYYLLQNPNKTIEDLENYYYINGDKGGVLKLIYLLKFNLNKTSESRELLLSSINQIIDTNNEYFHLLSNDEKEILYSNIKDQFEFLNTHLLFPYDDSFLADIINKRLYFKSLIFNNNVNNTDESKSYLLELNANKQLLSKYYEQQVDYENEINTLLNKNRELEKFLAQRKVKVDIPTVSEIQNKIKTDEAYVEIIRINKQSKSLTKDKLNILNKFSDSIYYGAIIIKRNTKPKFVLVDETNKLENDYLKNYKNHIDGDGKYIIDKESYSLFFEPLEKDLNGVNTILFVSDGIYNSINIETFYNPEKEKYLIEYLDINRMLSAKSVLKKVEDNNKFTATLLGNPQFDINQTTTEQKENNQVVLRDFKMDYLRENVEDKQLSYLPGTEKELSSIERILNNSQFNVDLFTNENATEKNLKSIESPKILHLATHGYFLRTEDKQDKVSLLMGMRTDNLASNVYLKSGLLLAGAQNTLDGNDSGIDIDNGIFTAEEAKNLNLNNTDLVVLSACETGLGDNKVGEGVYGLQRAFMIAGSKSVIMSLWKVNDNTTQKLMKLFYSNWLEKNMSKSEAFKNAKLELKKDYPEPFYWAPFVLIE